MSPRPSRSDRPKRSHTLRVKLVALVLGVAVAAVVGLSGVTLRAIEEIGESTQFASRAALEAQAKEHIGRVTNENAQRNARVLDEIMGDAILLANAMGRCWSSPASYLAPDWREQHSSLVRGAGGEHLQPLGEAASIHLPNFVPYDDRIREQVELGRRLDVFAQGVLAGSDHLTAVYLVTADSLTRYYADEPLELPPDLDVTKEFFFAGATPQENPSRGGHWTDVYDDPAGQGLMVSAVAPIYSDADDFVGIVGLDVRLEEIATTIESSELTEDSYSVLLDRSGQAIALPNRGYEDFLGRPRASQESGPKLAGAVSPMSTVVEAMLEGVPGVERVVGASGELFVAHEPLGNVGWSIATVVQVATVIEEAAIKQQRLNDQVVSRAARQLVPPGLLILAAVTALAALLAYRMTVPLRRLTHAAAALSRQEWDVEIAEGASSAEIEGLSETLASMASQVKGLVENLESRVAERTEELESALTMAKSATEARTRFLANMSHEIRTPLNGVIGMASLLETSDLDQQARGHVDVIRTCGEALLSTINDILDFSKLDAGKVALESRPFPLAELVSSCVTVIGPMAAEKGLSVAIEAPELDVDLVGDALRLQQVLVNFLGNAVKFSAGGEVLLRCRATVERPGGADLRFEVIDRGIGIPADVQKALFTPFVQADTSTTRRFGGTGLGLSICKQIVDQMDGSIGVTSEVGKGSCFHFEVSLPTTARTEKQAPGVRDDSLDRSGLRILLVEDNSVNQLVASRMLEKLGLSYDVAADGLEAVRAAEQVDYDLILMDMQMPVLDGLSATRRIRAMDKESQPRIVALTANAMEQDRDRCIEAGMDDFLSKPMRIEDLSRVVDTRQVDSTI